jgi:hypothetical protein
MVAVGAASMWEWEVGWWSSVAAAPGLRRVDACSGFLVEHDKIRVALDLGYGTLS